MRKIPILAIMAGAIFCAGGASAQGGSMLATTPPVLLLPELLSEGITGTISSMASAGR